MSLRDAAGLLLAMEAQDESLTGEIISKHPDLVELVLEVGILATCLAKELGDAVGLPIRHCLETIALEFAYNDD